MTVFKGYILIVRRNLGMLLMYIMIFIGIALAVQKSYQDSGLEDGFSSLRIRTAVIDRDGGVLAKALTQFLENHHQVAALPDDDQIIQEELFYRNVEFVLIIPEGAEERLKKGEQAVQSKAVPDSAAAYYMQAQIDQFLHQLRIYQKGGFTLEEACESVLALQEKEASVTLIDLNGNQGVRPDYDFYTGYMPFAVLNSAIMTLSIVIGQFKKREIRMRLSAGAVSARKQTAAMAATFAVVGLLIWGCCMIGQAILYQGGIFNDPNLGWFLLNSAACMAVALALGYLVGICADSQVALNGLNNVFSLGLCFLGGVFVPLEMLGPGVTKISRFLPTYWYSRINLILGDYRVLSSSLKQEIIQGLLIQMAFSLAVFTLALLLHRKRNAAN